MPSPDAKPTPIRLPVTAAGRLSRRIAAATVLAAFVGMSQLACPGPTEPPPPLEASGPAGPRAIIVMVADGAGFGTLEAVRAFTGRPLAVDDETEPWRSMAMATWPLRLRAELPEGGDPLAQDPALVYDPARAWSANPVDTVANEYPHFFDGYRWLLGTAADSACTMSAMMTGVATHNGAINVDGAGVHQRSLAEAMHEAGRLVGVVTNVPFNHATAAAGAGAHAESRNSYHLLAHEMFTAGVVSVIGGAGHPMWDNDGAPLPEPRYSYIDSFTWDDLVQGELRTPDGTPWTLVETPEAIRALASGPVPSRLAMIARRNGTLQQGRGSVGDPRATAPWEDPLGHDVPHLRDMVRTALHALEGDEDGFLLVIEGGAVDWAMHGNQCGRMIEEYVEFDETVAAVREWIDGHERFGWDDTLLVVTADHDHLLLGPESDREAFQPIEPRGVGVMPGHRWHSNWHTNKLVPLFVRGAGADRILDGERSTDPRRGPYFHQAHLGRTLLELAGARRGARGRADAASAPTRSTGRADD